MTSTVDETAIYYFIHCVEKYGVILEGRIKRATGNPWMRISYTSTSLPAQILESPLPQVPRQDQIFETLEEAQEGAENHLWKKIREHNSEMLRLVDIVESIIGRS